MQPATVLTLSARRNSVESFFGVSRISIVMLRYELGDARVRGGNVDSLVVCAGRRPAGARVDWLDGEPRRIARSRRKRFLALEAAEDADERRAHRLRQHRHKARRRESERGARGKRDDCLDVQLAVMEFGVGFNWRPAQALAHLRRVGDADNEILIADRREKRVVRLKVWIARELRARRFPVHFRDCDERPVDHQWPAAGQHGLGLGAPLWRYRQAKITGPKRHAAHVGHGLQNRDAIAWAHPAEIAVAHHLRTWWGRRASVEGGSPDFVLRHPWYRRLERQQVQ